MLPDLDADGTRDASRGTHRLRTRGRRHTGPTRGEHTNSATPDVHGPRRTDRTPPAPPAAPGTPALTHLRYLLVTPRSRPATHCTAPVRYMEPAGRRRPASASLRPALPLVPADQGTPTGALYGVVRATKLRAAQASRTRLPPGRLLGQDNRLAALSQLAPAGSAQLADGSAHHAGAVGEQAPGHRARSGVERTIRRRHRLRRLRRNVTGTGSGAG